MILYQKSFQCQIGVASYTIPAEWNWQGGTPLTPVHGSRFSKTVSCDLQSRGMLKNAFYHSPESIIFLHSINVKGAATAAFFLTSKKNKPLTFIPFPAAERNTYSRKQSGALSSARFFRLDEKSVACNTLDISGTAYNIARAFDNALLSNALDCKHHNLQVY